MTDPADRAEYERAFLANQRIDGYGFETTMHVPCPFCAAPDFTEWNIAEAAMTDNEPMKRERTCAQCGRSGKMLVVRGLDGVRAEFVQTGGDDPPAWLTPAPRRL